MEKIIIDTDIFIEATKGNVAVKKFTENLTADLCLSSISVAEILRGALNKNDYHILLKTISYFEILHLNENISHIFLNLMNRHSLSHRPGIADMIIAATALYHSAPVYTLNKKDYRFIANLKLI